MSIIRETKINYNQGTNINDIKKIAEVWGLPYEMYESGVSRHTLKITLDEDKKCFFVFESNNYNSNPGKMNIGIQYDDISKAVLSDFQHSYNVLYADRNPKATVLTLRTKATEGNCIIILAKDQKDDWSMIYGNKIITKNWTFDIQQSTINISDNLLYSAFAMPSVDNGSLFDGLLKMFTARSASEDSLYVAFNNKPYRVISACEYSSSADQSLPAYAFEARQE